MKHRLMWLSVSLILPLAGGCARQTAPTVNDTGSVSAVPGPPAATQHLTVTPPEHIVIVVEENHSYREIADSKHAPYIHALMQMGANFTNYHGVEHPSQPNYLDLFSGSNQGVTDDSCPHTFSAPNLASELSAAHRTFGGYSEDLPAVGYTGCRNGSTLWPWGATYARKHSPWVNFTNLPSGLNRPFSSFPQDFAELPTVSFVIPNLKHDMHDGTIEDADAWLRQNIDPYVQWATRNHSLLILTWDEDDKSASNQIPTIFVGPMVRSGSVADKLNHFNLLRTIEDLYRLPALDRSKAAAPATGIWQ